MSSLAAAQADGYYRPPDWDGKASLNKITGSKGAWYWVLGLVVWCFQDQSVAHPPSLPPFLPLLPGHNQFTQKGVIRFELPYNSWCLKCESHIGKGVRFNAQKKQVRRCEGFVSMAWVSLYV